MPGAADVMIARASHWIDVHARACLWTIGGIAVALRLLLAWFSPWAFGYVWDLYHEAVQLMYRTGRLPGSADCWECWQPPLLYLAAWPLYAIGRVVYPVSPWPDDYALRFVGIIPLASGLAVLYYTYRLLELLQLRPAWRLFGLALAAACPVLFFSTYSIEPDILLAGLLAAFTFHLMRWHLRPDMASRLDIARLGILAGLAAATKYSGLTAAVAGVLTMLLHAHRDRAAAAGVLRAVTAFVLITAAVGGWKYADNLARHGTPFFANGEAASGFRLTDRVLHTQYEFTTFRIVELLELTQPDAVSGMLDELPVYRSFWTTMHGLTWGDMGFFTNPTRHGTRYPYYRDRHVPSGLASDVLMLGIVPGLLALAGLLVAAPRREYAPLTIVTAVGWLIYLQYVLSQPIWAIKAKYLMFLLPVYSAYAMAGLQWVRRAAPHWMSAAAVCAVAALIVLGNVYLFRFALG